MEKYLMVRIIWNFGLLSIFSGRSFDILLASNSKGPMKCVSSKPLCSPFTVNVNKCDGSCNIIDESNVRVFVPYKVKYMNVKVFNLVSWVNEIRRLVQHELCESKCGQIK